MVYVVLLYGLIGDNMAELIKTINMGDDIVISTRNVFKSNSSKSIDIAQTTGSYVIANPYNEDGTMGGNVTIYPPSQAMDINYPLVLKSFRGTIDLYAPYDAKFDYIRKRLWIADTGNNRVLIYNTGTQLIETIIENQITYPHAIAVNLNTGGAFIKGYSGAYGLVYGANVDGVQGNRFEFDIDMIGSSSTSSEDIVDLITMPLASTICFDHVRDRCWWVYGNKSYMFDTRNQQVNSYDFTLNGLYSPRSIDLDYSSGNAILIIKDIASKWYMVQMSRDNNQYLARAYIKG